MNLTIRSCARCHRNQRQLLGSAAGSESSRTKLWSGVFYFFVHFVKESYQFANIWTYCIPPLGIGAESDHPGAAVPCMKSFPFHSMLLQGGFYRWIWDTLVSNSFPLIQTSSSYKNCTWGPVCLADHPSCSSGSMKSIQGVQFHPIVKVD